MSDMFVLLSVATIAQSFEQSNCSTVRERECGGTTMLVCRSRVLGREMSLGQAHFKAHQIITEDHRRRRLQGYKKGKLYTAGTSENPESTAMELGCSDVNLWRDALSSYPGRIESLNKPNLVSLDEFYRNQLPPLLHQRNPNPYITTPELSKLMQWKLSRGKWRPRLLEFVSSLDETQVKSASLKAFQSLPDISKAISELTVLKGVGPATASAVLAAYAPDISPFMSDEELSSNGQSFTPSDVERALWSVSIGAQLQASQSDPDPKTETIKSSKRKRKR